ncbi:ubiquinone biosynthesis accessory factor UbiJ [Fastidiosibacter lacustris]|uniref:ubiquinone biosynthesis accessory factor UbiJ n=1 Tax=Fastidiosibacter lacustris TaxID=2056695 RepID=UPI000E349E5F|nr:SCP2 sterol-binding domain-containing protein [Fastidiosibacter lacustris]
MDKNHVIKLINYLIYQTLRLDPQRNYLLQQLAGEALAVDIGDLNLSCVLIPQHNTLLLSITEMAANNRLRGKSSVLVAMCLSPNPQHFIQTDKVNFSGDIQVLQRYSNFFKAIRPDLIFTLTQGKNNTLSSLLDKPLTALNHWFRVSKEKLPIELREYLQYEKNFFPCRQELEDFFMDVQILKEDTDRVIAKLNKYLKLIEMIEGAHE